MDRTKAVGRCGVTAVPKVARAALHYWEEPIISGTRGSGTIFFSGCSLGCVFCQNYEISALRGGEAYTIERLIEDMRRLVAEGAHNINFVNPTHYAHVVKDALTIYRPPVPVVYNTGGYDKVSTLRELDGLIDVYLPDMKYFSKSLSARYSGREDYPQTAQAAIGEMYRQTGPAVLKDGIMQRGTIIRNLVLPNCVEDSKQVFDYLYATYGDNVFLSAMCQYVPYGRAAEYPEINRKLKPLEYKAVVAHLNKLGVKNCFVQELSSANEEFIPPFKTATDK